MSTVAEKIEFELVSAEHGALALNASQRVCVGGVSGLAADADEEDGVRHERGTGAPTCRRQVLGECSFALFSRRRESERLAALDVGRCTAGPCWTAGYWKAVARLVLLGRLLAANASVWEGR